MLLPDTIQAIVLELNNADPVSVSEVLIVDLVFLLIPLSVSLFSLSLSLTISLSESLSLSLSLSCCFSSHSPAP